MCFFFDSLISFHFSCFFFLLAFLFICSEGRAGRATRDLLAEHLFSALSSACVPATLFCLSSLCCVCRTCPYWVCCVSRLCWVFFSWVFGLSSLSPFSDFSGFFRVQKLLRTFRSPRFQIVLCLLWLIRGSLQSGSSPALCNLLPPPASVLSVCRSQ